MQILQLAPQVAYPLLDGGKVGIFNITKHLALRGHKITMLALDVAEVGTGRGLEDYCELIKVRHSNKNSIVGAFVNLFSKLPYNISKYRSKHLQLELLHLLRTCEFDVVHVDHLHMAHYGVICKEAKGLPIVLREHNIESLIMERFAETAASPLIRHWLALQLPRIKLHEAKMASQFDYCCVISEEDKQRLLALQPKARVRVVPGGVDTIYFLDQQKVEKIPFSICYFGNFDWLPNQDAVQWFLERVLPKIVARQVLTKFYIVGKNIPKKIKRWQNSNVTVRGFATDIRQEMQQYEITVVPLRIGSGMRLKILESFAMRIPVVSTSIGCEGIEANHNEHLLVADTEDEFARQVIRLFEDHELKRYLVTNAHALVSKAYRWETVAEEFEKAYKDAISNKAFRQ